jgi:hypothetical protein
MADDYLWDPSAAPDREIERLEAALRPMAHTPQPMRADLQAARPRRLRMTRWHGVAAALLLAVGGVLTARATRATPWTVDARSGAPSVRSATGGATPGTLERGGVVETDAASSARIAVGRIGRADIGPGSRLRLLGTGATQHLLSLERGTMHASIDAPPRWFVVQTASALAVDLGCEYELTVDEQGNGILRVEEGEVELQAGDVRIAVLAGNAAALRSGRGPGLPYPVRAGVVLRRAIARYDATGSDEAIAAVLASADSTSTITLWHLLQRATPAQRERVFARLAAIDPPPATVTRERIVRGESGALQRWRTNLQPGWASRPPIWRRAWLALRR